MSAIIRKGGELMVELTETVQAKVIVNPNKPPKIFEIVETDEETLSPGAVGEIPFWITDIDNIIDGLHTLRNELRLKYGYDMNGKAHEKADDSD